jgi:hypothetical protein
MQHNTRQRNTHFAEGVGINDLFASTRDAKFTEKKPMCKKREFCHFVCLLGSTKAVRANIKARGRQKACQTSTKSF